MQRHSRMPSPSSPPAQPRSPWLPAAAALALAAASALYRVRTFDTFFHLAAGRYILDTGSRPATDPFSFTFHGAPWTNHSWGFQLILAHLHAGSGFEGISLYQAAIAAALMAVSLCSLARRPLQLWLGAPLAVLPFVALREVLEARPHVLGFLALAAILELWRRSDVTPSGPALPPLAAMLAIYAAWACVHGSHVLLFPLLALAVLCCLATRQWARGARLAAFAAVCGGLGWLLAPHAPIQGTEHVLSRFLESSVSEWYPLTPRDLLEAWPVRLFAACWALAGAGVLFELRVLGSLRASAPRLPLLAVLLALMLFGLSSHRMLALFWFAAAPLWLPSAVMPLAALFIALMPRFARATAALRALSSGLLVAAGVALLLGNEQFSSGLGLAPQRFPAAAVAAMRAHGGIDRLYNAYNFGGYLMYERFPRAGVFVDGRATTVYPDAFLQAFRQAYDDPTRFEALIQRYPVDGVLLQTRSTVSAPLSRYLTTNPHWRLLYRDAVAEVFAPSAGTKAPAAALRTDPPR